MFQHLMEKHQELESISMKCLSHVSRIEDEDEVVLEVFSNPNLNFITISDVNITEDIFRTLPSNLPNLEKLKLTSWKQLSDEGLIEILKRCRSNLTELDLFSYPLT